MGTVDPEDLDVGLSIKSILALGWSPDSPLPAMPLKKITRISLAISKIKSDENGKVASSASWLIECQDVFRIPILVD